MGSHRVGHDWSDLAAAAAECLIGERIQAPSSLLVCGLLSVSLGREFRGDFTRDRWDFPSFLGSSALSRCLSCTLLGITAGDEGSRFHHQAPQARAGVTGWRSISGALLVGLMTFGDCEVSTAGILMDLKSIVQSLSLTVAVQIQTCCFLKTIYHSKMCCSPFFKLQLHWAIIHIPYNSPISSVQLNGCSYILRTLQPSPQF